MTNNISKAVLYLMLISMAPVVNAVESDNVKPSKSECVSRLSSDVNKVSDLSENAGNIDALQKLSRIYSHCAFYFQKKEVFYSYMQVADNISIMVSQLELYYDGVKPLQYNEDKNKVIGSLGKLIALKL